MKGSFLNELNKIFNKRYKNVFFSNLGYLPRWIVLWIDLCIVIFATIMTHFLLRDLGIASYKVFSWSYKYSIVTMANVLCFVIFKTYSGLIRYSSFIDGIKLLISTSTSFFLLVIFNKIYFYITGHTTYLFSSLLINWVLTFSLLFLFRVFVKNMYESFFSEYNKTPLNKAMILGTDNNSISVANALMAERPSRFKLVGFIDRSSLHTHKQILGLPIIGLRRPIPVLLKFFKVQSLIIADKSLSHEEHIDIVNLCLDYGVKIYTAPLVSDWQEEKDFSKKIRSIRIEDLLNRKPIVLDSFNIINQLKGKCILITGGAGSIGSEIIRQIAAFSPKLLLILDQAESPLYDMGLEMKEKFSNINCVSILADITNYDIIKQVFEKYKPDIVYHAAAYKHVPLMEENPSQSIFVNIMGTKNIANLSVLYNVDKFVMISTDKAVNPSSVMGASKRIAEMYVQSLFFDLQSKHKICPRFITTRFGNVLGSNGSVVPLFTKQIEKGGPITVTHPDVIRYFMTIPEACQLVLEAGAMGKGGEIYIFDMGKPVKIIDLARKMIQLAGYVPEQDIKIKITGLRPGEKLYEELLTDTSKTLATHHKKIMIAQDPLLVPYNYINSIIEEMQVLALEDRKQEIVVKMKVLVPEFISKNSDYKTLDNQLGQALANL